MAASDERTVEAGRLVSVPRIDAARDRRWVGSRHERQSEKVNSSVCSVFAKDHPGSGRSMATSSRGLPGRRKVPRRLRKRESERCLLTNSHPPASRSCISVRNARHACTHECMILTTEMTAAPTRNIEMTICSIPPPLGVCHRFKPSLEKSA